jgi:prepilin-type processing-associated H-X9-DG protein
LQDDDDTYPQAEDLNNQTWTVYIQPYIKSGGDTSAVETEDDMDESLGVWTCPDFPSYATEWGSSYAVNMSLFPTPNTYFTAMGPSETEAIVQTPTLTVLACEVGANDGYYPYQYFDPTQDFWASGTGTAAGNYLNYTHYDLGYSPGEGTTGNCDASPGQILANNDTYGGCGMMPIYRHVSNTVSNFLYCDGHTKAVEAGQLSWLESIYIAGAYQKIECYPGSEFCNGPIASGL